MHLLRSSSWTSGNDEGVGALSDIEAVTQCVAKYAVDCKLGCHRRQYTCNRCVESWRWTGQGRLDARDYGGWSNDGVEAETKVVILQGSRDGWLVARAMVSGVRKA